MAGEWPALVWVDYIFIVVVILSAIFSLFRGFVREVLSLLGWAASLWVAMQFSESASMMLEGLITSPVMRHAVTFTGLLITVMVLCSVLSRFIAKLVHLSGLTALDRMIGVVFGVLRGAVVVMVLVLVGNMSPLANTSIWQSSTIVPYSHHITAWVADNLMVEDSMMGDWRSLASLD